MHLRRQSGSRALVIGLILAAAFTPGCQRGRPPAAGQAEPPKPVAPVRLSSYVPDKPYQEFAPGLLAQTVYVADAGGPYRVEIWDLLVGPGKKSGAAKLPG